jgi:hypothetical protein
MGLLHDLLVKGAALWFEGGELKYRFPKGILTTDVLTELRLRKDELVGQLRRALSPGSLDCDLAPATFQQEWLWDVLRRYENWNSLLYAFSLRLSGPMEPEFFLGCISEVMHRHPILRTRLEIIDGRLIQIVASNESARLTWEKISVVEGKDPDEQAREFVEGFLNGIVSPQSAPLFAFKLLQLTSSDHVLTIAQHHIISDACSLSILFRELWTLYYKGTPEISACLGRIPATYADYAIWQRQTESAWNQRHAAYWNKQLERAPRTRLKVFDQEDDKQGGEAAELMVTIDEQLSAQVRSLARSAKTLLSLTMFAIFVAVVSRSSGERDLMIPFACTGRHLPEHEDMIGFFGYYVYLRLQVDPLCPFRTLLSQVAQEVFEVMERQDYTRALASMPALGRNPSFNWVSVHPGDITGIPTAPNLNMQAVRLEVTPFQFTRVVQTPKALETDGEPEDQAYTGVIFYDTGTTLRGTFYCDPRHCSTISAFVEDFKRAASEFCADPDLCVSRWCRSGAG